jgi:hypothetical protein
VHMWTGGALRGSGRPHVCDGLRDPTTRARAHTLDALSPPHRAPSSRPTRPRRRALLVPTSTPVAYPTRRASPDRPTSTTRAPNQTASPKPDPPPTRAPNQTGPLNFTHLPTPYPTHTVLPNSTHHSTPYPTQHALPNSTILPTLHAFVFCLFFPSFNFTSSLTYSTHFSYLYCSHNSHHT